MSKDNPLPLSVCDVTLASDFLQHFTEKNAKLGDNLDNIELSTGTLSQTIDNENSGKIVPFFYQFKPLSETKVTKLIKNS